MRSLAADLGAALGGVAHLAELRRLRVGSFTIDEAHTLEAIEADPDAALLTPARRDARPRAGRRRRRAKSRAVAHGVDVPGAPSSPADAGAGPFAVLDTDGDLLAVYERRGAGVKPAVVLAPVEAT